MKKPVKGVKEHIIIMPLLSAAECLEHVSVRSNHGTYGRPRVAIREGPLFRTARPSRIAASTTTTMLSSCSSETRCWGGSVVRQARGKEAIRFRLASREIAI